jgi:intein/homing endonuclease/MoxR-like ATPase
MAKTIAKPAKPAPTATANSSGGDILRQPAELEYAHELAALAETDRDARPDGWKLSPKAVRTYLLGGKAGEVEIKPKYMGNERVVEIAIATLATDRALLLIGEPGTAKCVKFDTLLFDTHTGARVTAEEAYRRRDLHLATLGQNYKLRSQSPSEYLDNGIRACFRVMTRLGREIEVTANHPFLTLDGWKPLKELQVGDAVAQVRELPFFGQGQLSDSQVKLLAHLIAEGCLTSNLPNFCNLDPLMQKDFSDAVVEAFPGLQAHWNSEGRSCGVSGGKRGPKAKNPCTAWLRELGLMGTNSATKFIPDIVFTLPKTQIALFLSRLFSGDGFLHVRRGTGQVTIDYASKSKRLIYGVQHLLVRFGINARIARRQGGHFRLFIHGRLQCLTFLREIGLVNQEKTAKAIAHLEHREGKENPNCDLIPIQIWERINIAAVHAGYRNATALVKTLRGDKYKGGGPRRTQGVSRTRLERLAEHLHDAELSRLAQSDIYWDPIISIEPVGEHRVYDLSMAGTHNFVANDFIIHNSWLSEHLTAAVAGDSLQIVQGTAGTTEEQIRYTWNYALLLAEGPSPKALVPSPVYRAMHDGKLVRFEEITRCPAEVQDALITLLSEKVMAVPELGFHVAAKRGFNLIATANTRDRGVNEMSAALKRRFNIVVLPVPSDVDTEVQIVAKRVAEIGTGLKLPAPPPAEEAVRKIVQIFQELRRGQTLDGRQKIKPPSGVLSTAEAISLLGNSMALAGHFGSGTVTDRDLAAGLQGVVVKEDSRDGAIWLEYLENVMKKRADWQPLYTACKELAE